MIKQLITFDGGLSTKVSPNLIQPNEAIECVDVNLEKGILTPSTTDLFYEATTGQHGYYKDGKYIFNTGLADDRFYAEYGDNLFWSNLGLNTSGVMKYESIINGFTELTTTTTAIYAVNDIIQLGTEDRFFTCILINTIGIELDNVTYFTESHESTGVDAVAPVSPNQIAVAAISGGHLGDAVDYTYCYTFVDATYLEGTPTVFATITTASPSLQIEITINPTNTPADVVKVNIYRTGGANPTFNLVGELDYTDATGSTTFTDTTRDIDVSRIELTSFDNAPAPSNLDMLIENNGTFWGAAGDRVYFSRTGSPYFWNPLNYVVLNGTCTGLGKIGNSMVAFTSSDMYRIDGWNTDNIFRTKLPYNQGCKNKRTVTNVDSYLFWVSDNGICLYDGNTVVVVTKTLLEWNEFARIGNQTWGDFVDERYNSGLGFEIIYAKAYQDKFYGVYADGIVIIDTSNGIKASTINGQDILSLTLNRTENVLSYVKLEDSIYNLYSIGGGSTLNTAIWKTGELADEGINIRKFYRKVSVIGHIGSFLRVTILVDGTEIMVSQDTKTFFLPSGKSGYNIQFKIETDGAISGLKYEYSINGVQHG